MASLVFASGYTAEATVYRAAIRAAGGQISVPQLTALNRFVKTGKAAGWYSKLIDCCPLLGTSITAGLVKLVAAPGAGASYVNNGVGGYDENGGLTVSGNTTGYVSTGVIPGNHGLSDTNLSMGFGSVIGPTYSGQGLIGCHEADVSDVAALSVQPYGGFGIRNALALTRCYCGAFSYGVNTTRSAMDGIRTADVPVNNAVANVNNELELFRVTKTGVRYLTGTGNVGFFFVGSDMTANDLRSLTAAARQLHLSARGVTVTTRDVVLGDSITKGQGIANQANVWVEIVRAARSSDLLNLGFSGTTFLDAAGSGTLAGENRYLGSDAFPISTWFCMMGSNDIAVADLTTNGDSSVLMSYRTKLALMADTLQAQGAQVVICSLPYTTRGNATKVLAWADAALNAALDAGAIGVDTCRPMIASGNPGQYLQDDVHLNEAGQALVADLVLGAL